MLSLSIDSCRGIYSVAEYNLPDQDSYNMNGTRHDGQ